MNTSDKVWPGRPADARDDLIRMARRNMRHTEAGTIEQTDGVVRIPASNYSDEQQWQREVDQVFKRVPLMLAMSCELTKAGKTAEIKKLQLYPRFICGNCGQKANTEGSLCAPGPFHT